MFEAGVIAASVEKPRLCAILFGLKPTDVKEPLSQFQLTSFAADQMLKLFETINSTAGNIGLEQSRLKMIFDMWWPKLELPIQKIMAEPTAPTAKHRPSEELIYETLLLVRNLQNVPERLTALERRMAPTFAVSREPSLLGSGGIANSAIGSGPFAAAIGAGGVGPDDFNMGTNFLGSASARSDVRGPRMPIAGVDTDTSKLTSSE